MSGKAIVKSGLSELILESTSAPIFALDGTFCIVFWNRSLASLTGLSSEQAAGQSFPATCLSPADRSPWTLAMERVSILPFDLKFNCAVAGLPILTLACNFTRISSNEGDLLVGTVSELLSRTRADHSQDSMDDRTAEKRELSRFLHDTVAQDLVKLSFFAHELPDEAMKAPPPAGIDVQAARQLIDRCCSDIRTVSLILTPVLQPGMPLHAAIEYYLRCFREETGMSVIADLDPLPATSKEAELLFCTIMQTWLARTIRFDRSAAVTVRLRERGYAVSLELEARLSARPVAPGCFQEDWAVVRERVAAMGGEFAIVPDTESVRCKVLVSTF